MPVTLSHTSTAREQAIVDLLRLYRDLEGASSSGAVGGYETGDRMLYVDGGPWDKSGCDALDDLLRRLKAERPIQWWHLTERYLRCDIRSRRVKVSRNHRGALRAPKLGPYCEPLGHGVRPTDTWLSSEMLIVVETWAPGVRLEKVRHGVAYLARRFPWDNFRWRDLRNAPEVAA